MHRRIQICLMLLVASISHLLSHAQAGSAGPTMEQTIAFINDSIAKEAQDQAASGSFTLKYVLDHAPEATGCSVFAEEHDGSRQTYFLETGDPSSASIKGERIGDAPVYTVLVGRMSSTKSWPGVQPLDEANIPLDRRRGIGFWGYVFGVDGNILTAIVFDSDFEEEGKSKPRLFQTTIDENTSLRYLLPRDGLSDRTLHLVSSSTSGITIPLKDVIVGDLLDIDVGRDKKYRPKGRVITLYRHSQRSTDAPLSFGPFHNRDRAERVAKAVVHAIVLCHKDDKPSLF